MLAAVFGDAGVTAANSRVVFYALLARPTSPAYSNNFGDFFTRLSPLLQHNFDTYLDSYSYEWKIRFTHMRSACGVTH